MQFFYESRVCLYIKTPNQALGWMTYFNPFSFYSWLVTLAVMLLAALVLALPFYLDEWTRDRENYNYCLAFFATLASLFQQGNLVMF